MDASRRILDEYYDEGNLSYACPSWAPTVGFVGIASAVVFASKFVAFGLGLEPKMEESNRVESRQMKKDKRAEMAIELLEFANVIS
jgi:hypothetical protein